MTIELTEQEAKLIFDILTFDDKQSKTSREIIKNIKNKLAEQLN